MLNWFRSKKALVKRIEELSSMLKFCLSEIERGKRREQSYNKGLYVGYRKVICDKCGEDLFKDAKIYWNFQYRLDHCQTVLDNNNWLTIDVNSSYSIDSTDKINDTMNEPKLTDRHLCKRCKEIVLCELQNIPKERLLFNWRIVEALLKGD